VRRVEDPLTATAATLDEYCIGNRVVSIRQSKVVIVDYDARQVTETDRDAKTWSVTSFDEIARSRADLSARLGVDAPRSSDHAPGTLTSKGGTAAESFERIEPNRRLEVTFDRSVVLSRAAAEVLMGTAYPEERAEGDEEILNAASAGSAGRAVGALSAAASGDEERYGLLVERTLTIDSAGTRLISRNAVIHVGAEMPPADALLIDPGAKRVESRLTRLARELRDADALPSRVRH